MSLTGFLWPGRGRARGINRGMRTGLSISALVLSALVLIENAIAQEIPVFRSTVIRVYPHDPEAFTQGLTFHDGWLYEGTGLRGQSTLRRVDLDTGRVARTRSLPFSYFGEGISIVGDRIVQLTWKSKTGFVYDRDSFRMIGRFKYPTEGWGLTFDGTHLIMSDGSASLYWLNPDSFTIIRKIKVFDHHGPVKGLNELEYARGEVLANVWRTTSIARIAPATGQISGWISLEGLLDAKDRNATTGVANGIAYDAKAKRLFVTGKRWPKLFEIELVAAD